MFGCQVFSKFLISTHPIHFLSHSGTGCKLNSSKWVVAQDYSFRISSRITKCQLIQCNHTWFDSGYVQLHCAIALGFIYKMIFLLQLFTVQTVINSLLQNKELVWKEVLQIWHRQNLPFTSAGMFQSAQGTVVNSRPFQWDTPEWAEVLYRDSSGNNHSINQKCS